MERVSNLDQTGMAVVNGQEWTVRTEDDKTIIEQGELVRIIRISGVKLIVERVNSFRIFSVVVFSILDLV